MAVWHLHMEQRLERLSPINQLGRAAFIIHADHGRRSAVTSTEAVVPLGLA